MTSSGSISSVVSAVRGKRVSAVEVARGAMERLRAVEPRVKAFLQVFDERALEQAKAVDAKVAAGRDPGVLAGVPVALKDNMCLEWGRTTCASRILENYESPYTATAVRRLIEAGAVIVGKTNMDEFAMGSSGENSAFGATRNPWDESRVPGGSSAGSAAAVAAGVVPLSFGSDTGGSIRQPAALCGVYGMKPTYGRVSRYGLVAFASSLDQIGPFGRTVGDVAAALSVICGRDPFDATSSGREVPDFGAGLEGEAFEFGGPLVIGVPRQARNAANHASITATLDRTIEKFVSLGAEIVEVDLPHAEYGIAAYYIVAPAEASSNLARFDGVRYGRRAELGAGEDLMALYCRSRAEGFGAEVQRRIMLGTHVLSSGYYDAYYTTALRVRRRIKQDYDACFAPHAANGEARPACHALLLPAAPGPAFKIGEKAADPLAMYLEDLYTVGVNLAGLPGLTFPAGMAEVEGKRLPVGMQLIGPAWEEARLLRIARMFEAATEWAGMRPAI